MTNPLDIFRDLHDFAERIQPGAGERFLRDFVAKFDRAEPQLVTNLVAFINRCDSIEKLAEFICLGMDADDPVAAEIRHRINAARDDAISRGLDAWGQFEAATMEASRISAEISLKLQRQPTGVQ